MIELVQPLPGEIVMPRIVHFELPVDDAKRASAFYESVFGWSVEDWESDEGYWPVTTGSEEPGIDTLRLSQGSRITFPTVVRLSIAPCASSVLSSAYLA
jgi:hypothetical protein